jgi:alpha-galactosidase
MCYGTHGIAGDLAAATVLKGGCSTMQAEQQPERIAPGVTAHPNGRRWALVGPTSMLALRATAAGIVVQDYWGPTLPFWGDIPLLGWPPDRSSQDLALSLAQEVLPSWGGLRFDEYAARCRFADGTRDLDLRFADAAITDDATTLLVTLTDAAYPLSIALRWHLAGDLIVAGATFSNTGSAPITLLRAYSAAWHLPPAADGRTLVTLAGHWAGETRIQTAPLAPGEVLLQSRRGITGADAQPWFAITEPGSDPHVFVGALAWSGNWHLRLSTRVTGATRITGGLSDDDFAWHLAPGAPFTTPDFVAGCVAGDLNDARAALHRYVLAEVLPLPQCATPLPVLYNSWEATFFFVTEPSQRELAEAAAALGVELFVVDDGWFAGRNDDSAGLGDWRPDPLAFPDGLRPLADHVRRLGMAFGLWVEPEMVNPDSDLYRAHPDWVYHFPRRPRSEARHQLVLNLAREDVRAYLLAALDDLVRVNEIAFLKWDMNRPISEPGWPEHPEMAQEIWVRHVQGVYGILDELRRRHPGVLIESCASGGGRADLGILRRADQIWTSDNTHPLARLAIQEGFSLPFPPRVMVNWVTDTPWDQRRNEIPLRFRFHVAMLGTLGIGGNLAIWDDADRQEATNLIAHYKRIRHLIQGGRCAWLRSLRTSDHAAVSFVAEDGGEAVIFGFRPANPFGEAIPPVRLRGLVPAARYRMGGDAPEQIVSGAALMRVGLALPLPSGLFASCLVHIEMVRD